MHYRARKVTVTKKEHSSIMIVHFHKDGGLTRDKLKKGIVKIDGAEAEKS